MCDWSGSILAQHPDPDRELGEVNLTLPATLAIPLEPRLRDGEPRLSSCRTADRREK
jgi:hypothetical protein